MSTTVRLTTRLNAIIHEAEEGGYWAEVPSLPGCFTQAETRTSLMRNLRAAIALYVEDQKPAKKTGTKKRVGKSTSLQSAVKTPRR